MMQSTPHIEPPYCYRCSFNLDYPGCGLRCAHALEDAIKINGRETIAAFIAEPICGASLGAVEPPPEYWPLIRDICTHYQILLIADEVMTGFGRTGAWFATQHWQVEPDIIHHGQRYGRGIFPAVDHRRQIRRCRDASLRARGFYSRRHVLAPPGGGNGWIGRAALPATARFD